MVKMVKVKDLKEGMQGVSIDVEVDFIGSNQRSASYGDQNFVITFVKDETGEIKMTFFGDEALDIKAGTKVHLKNGFVTMYRDQLQLSYSQESDITFEKPKKKKQNW